MTNRVALIIAVLLLSQPCWGNYSFFASFITHGVSSGDRGSKLTVQSLPSATDGYDNPYWDALLSSFPWPFWVAAYKANGLDGWDAADGFYGVDTRAALTTGQTKIEDIYVWAAMNTPPEDIVFSQMSATAPDQGTYALRLISVPSGINYTGPTEWGAGSVEILLPYYSTTDGRTGYHFQAEFTAIPEPSSILALGLAVSGVGASMVRRRRV